MSFGYHRGKEGPGKNYVPKGGNQPIPRSASLSQVETLLEGEPVTVLPIVTKLTRQAAAGMGFTGDECPKCGSMQMVHTGHCNTCQACGETTGCS